MTKQILLLESSREIYLARRISLNFETIKIYTFFEASRFGCRKTIFVSSSKCKKGENMRGGGGDQ